jgi:CheY-like chemotaxis protein/HPt (histidine-containing phosphotransfer) domain-containing protein
VEVRFKVSDTGVGIPEDRLSKIFDPFTQADDSVTRVYTGTGLGLTIVKQTIEAMGGSVQVTSTVGTGSTFTLVVPLTRASSMPRAVRCPLPHGAAVAVVDGESAAARFLAKKMERFGLVSEVIASGERSELSQLAAPVGRYGLLVVTSEAIKRSAVFDLVVTCAAEQRMPIVVILSPFEIAARERLVALGVPYLLTRPVSVEDILLSVSGVCEASSCKWQEDQEAALSHARHLKVLVVDDARTNRIILSNMLEDAGHTVKCLENGLDLFNTIQRALRGEEGAEQFDVVLTDVQMPLMDGITATRKIRELESELGVSAALPIFAVTAHAMREETEEMQRSGVNGVVTKPIEPKQLVQALEGIPARPGPGALATFPTNVHDSLGTRASWETIEDLADLVRRVWRRLEIDEKRLVVPEVDDGDWAIEKMLDVQDVYTRVGDSTKRVQLILRVFSESFKDQLTQIVAARSDTDPKELQYAAHAIKGLLLDVGAKQPAAIASLIESMCKRGEAEESKRLITPLSEQVLVVARLIERMLQTLKFEVADDSSRDAHVC